MSCCYKEEDSNGYKLLLEVLNKYDLTNCNIDILLSECTMHGNVNKDTLRNRILAYREYMNAGFTIKNVELKYSICKNCLYDFIVKYELPTRDNKGYMAYNYYMNNDVKMKFAADRFNVSVNYFYRLVKELGGKKKR